MVYFNCDKFEILNGILHSGQNVVLERFALHCCNEESSFIQLKGRNSLFWLNKQNYYYIFCIHLNKVLKHLKKLNGLSYQSAVLVEDTANIKLQYCTCNIGRLLHLLKIHFVYIHIHTYILSIFITSIGYYYLLVNLSLINLFLQQFDATNTSQKESRQPT